MMRNIVDISAFPLSFLVAQFNSSSHPNTSLLRSHSCRLFFQIQLEKEHSKNKWFLVSCPCWHRTHLPSTSIPHSFNPSIVGSLLRVDIHAMIMCLGIARGVHKSLCQATFSFFGLSSCQTLAAWYFFLGNFHTSIPFFFPQIFVLEVLVATIFSRSSYYFVCPRLTINSILSEHKLGSNLSTMLRIGRGLSINSEECKPGSNCVYLSVLTLLLP